MAQVVEFYKAWDRHGALSNFSPHSVELPGSPVAACGALGGGPLRAWPSVEHFYQAQKFAGAALFVLGGFVSCCPPAPETRRGARVTGITNRRRSWVRFYCGAVRCASA